MSVFPPRLAIVVAVVALLAACGDSGATFDACARGAITAPPSPRFHDVVTTDSAWREHIVDDVAAFRADTTVRVQLVHKSAVIASDRDRVTTAGGTIVGETPAANGITAAFAVASLRTFAPSAPLDRVIDGHLLGANGLPICD
jgi:ABC-type glycerol-3-phosphate transport system substrate-binding protein